ncbi:Adenosine monophosphate-protein transferase SoFic [Phycisphaerae bacterium RAS1]|nr:Adenosine monophosphate-protein transferase SoFic [Phycisphaerae bacterium RAS1]
MDPRSFVTDRAGDVRKTATGYWTFVPRRLPPEVEYTPRLTLLLSQADAALSELSGLGRYLPNPDLLIAPYVKREAVASSRIEGTQADLSDLLMDEIEPKRTPAGSDVLEVRNYVAALNRGLRQLDKLPLAGRLVRDLHKVLMQGVRGQERTPGEFRRSPNWIGPPGSTLTTATYVPPPPDPEMHECLKHWEVFVNQRGTMPELVQCALIHEHFEAIHPFLDGNGRIGRLLITLFLIERGRLSKPLLYLSSYIEQTKAAYYGALQRIRTHGDWPAWLQYFLTAVRDTGRSAIEQSQSILRLRDDFRGKLGKQHRALTLLDELFINPYTTVARACERLGVTAPTAQKTIAALENVGMLSEATGAKWGRVWLARPILKAVEATPPIADL